MDIEVITQYILAIVPAFTAVVGMVVTLGVGIGNIKKANRETTDTVLEISKENRQIKNDISSIVKENKELRKENKELKQHLNKITAKMEHMYFVDKENEMEE